MGISGILFFKAARGALLFPLCFLSSVFPLFPPLSAGESPLRLVSLAPSLTEMAFALGAGGDLVGVTDQCRYPPEAAALPKTGGYQAPNFEAIMALRPDMVLALEEHAPSFALMDSLGLKYAVFDHRSLPGILDSLTRLGEMCGRAPRAAALRETLAAAFLPPPGYDAESAPRVLFVIGRDYGSGIVSNAAVIGKDNLYDLLIAAAGFRNAYEGGLAYPVLSGEGVALLDPDIIIEAVYAEMGTNLGEESLRADWRSLASLRAVSEGRIHYFHSDYVFIPGMRMILLKDEIAASASEKE